MSESTTASTSAPQHPRVGAKRIVQIIAAVLAAGASAVMLFVPSYRVETSDSAGNVSAGSSTVLDVLGPWALALALIPVVITLASIVVPTHARSWTTILATVLLAIWIILGIWTIGGFYVPAFLCLLVSVFIRRRSGFGV